MKYLRDILLFFLLVAFAGSAYAQNEKKITVTIFPVYSIVKMITGDNISINLVVPQNESIHTFQLKPSHIKLLSESDVIFYVDDMMEVFMSKMKRIIKNKLVVNLLFESEIKVLSKNDSNCYYSEPLNIKNYDTHVWLDPMITINMLKTVARVLSDADPKNKHLYKKNLDVALKKMESLHKDVSKIVKNATSNSFIVFHDAYKYFSCRYSIKNIKSINISDESTPSIKTILEIRKNADKNTCFLFEPNTTGYVLQNKFKYTKKHAIIDPTGITLKAEPTDEYTRILTNVAKAFAECTEN